MRPTRKQWKRELASIVEGEGGQVLGIDVTNGSHYRVRAEFPTRTVSVVTSQSPSDYRSGLNFKRDLRRLLRTPP